MSGYRSRDVARLLDLPVDEVRRLARAGLVSPARGARNELRFSFQDLVVLRAAAGLVHARVPKRRVRRALRRLRAQLPAGRPLGGVLVAADAGRVLAQDGGARWHAESGQVLLDFDAADVVPEVAPIGRPGPPSGGGAPLDAEAWYRWGNELEGSAPGEARDAYRRALAHDPHHAGAHVNLGRLLHEAGDVAAAEIHYRLALDSAEHRAIAAFDLGVALEDQGLDDEALLAYARAIEADPALADAHLNASRLLERMGRSADALRHLAQYRRLTGGEGGR